MIRLANRGGARFAADFASPMQPFLARGVPSATNRQDISERRRSGDWSAVAPARWLAARTYVHEQHIEGSGRLNMNISNDSLITIIVVYINAKDHGRARHHRGSDSTHHEDG